ncbi:YvcK family protein [Candidatus Woesebacteria bacterium]|nr:YvcK family protein [Candidatus Woesebacteria bacterium]
MIQKRVVVIGGGTGTYQVLVGLKKYPIEISAVVAMSDSGGSSGRLRKEFSILPPGDVRRALLALSNLPLARKTLEKLFNYRFQEGEGLKGHSLGNLLLAALTQITGREDLAIKEAGRILAVSGFVYPVTLDKTNLVAVLRNGKRIYGETNIDLRWYGKKFAKIPIKKVYLSPRAKAYPEIKSAIREASLVVIGPGDLYTSIIPNLLVKGVNEALSTSVDTLGWYKKFHSEPVKNDVMEGGVRVIGGSFVTRGEFLRHDPAKLAKTIIKLLKE